MLVAVRGKLRHALPLARVEAGALLDLPPERPEWVRIPGALGTKRGAEWVHRSGWRVKHCGHPTALFPYYGIRPGGDERFKDELLLSGGWGQGRGFMRLADAKAAVLEQIALRRLPPKPAAG